MGRTKKKVKTVNMAIADFDFEALIEFGRQNRNKRNQYSLLEEFKNQSESDITKTITNLCQMLMKCLEKYVAGGSAKKNWTSSDAQTAGKLIQVTVDIALVTLQLKFNMSCHVELAVLLNGILPSMPNSLDSVKNSICQYCEKLSITNVSDKSEFFLYNVFPYLIRRTLGNKVVKTDVKRIYAIRDKLAAVMNMKETRKKEMWDLFKVIAVNAIYMSMIEGQKIIALSLTLDIDKVLEVHQVVKKMIPEMNIKFASGYGRAYFEAWCYTVKRKNPEMKNVIEISCVQDFILTALRSKNRLVMPVIRKILAEFHLYKKEIEVARMLYGLYQPLLWKYLKNPDGMIRANAAQLFLDIFPLEDPDVRIVASNLELNDQLLMIRELLIDDFPIVRITSVLAICISMSVNWEVYPGEMIKTYFRIIINDLSRDSSNHEVRCAVVKGLKCLLENPLTLQCLIALLPKLRGLFHDISEPVRVAFCQLLMRIKRISAIKYFDIVPLLELIARMEEDSPSVQRVITHLLSNSYFPQQQDPKLWLGRCLELIKTNRNASRVLFTHIMHYVDIKSCVNFMCQVARAIHFYVRTKNAPVPSNLEICNKENIVNMEEYMNTLEAAVGFNNLKTVGALFDGIAIMWLSMKQDLELSTNKGHLKMFVAKVGPAMADLTVYYKDTEAWESVFYTASILPPMNVPSLGSLCFWKLKNLPHNAKPDDYVTLLECLCNHKQGFELVSLMKEWLEVGLSDSYVPPPAAKKRRRGKSGDNINYDQPKPYLANQMLDTILSQRCLQRCVAQNPKAMLQIIYLFDFIKRKLERFNAKLINETEANFLGLLVHNILRLSLYLHSYDEMNAAKFLNEIVEWTEQKLIPHLTFSEEGTDNFTTLIHTICMSLARILADAAVLEIVEPNSNIPLLFFEKLLASELGYKYALITMSFLYKYSVTCLFMYVQEDDTVMFEHLLASLLKIMEAFRNETLLESIPALDYKEVQFALGNLMHVVRNAINVLVEPTTAVFTVVVSGIIYSIVEKTKTIVEELSDESFEKIVVPKVGAFFLFMVNQKPKLIATYMKCLTLLYKSLTPDISLWIAFWNVLYNILGRKDMASAILTETNILVYNLEKTIHKLYPRKNANSSQEMSDSPKMQIFQQHCHAAFLKLKNRQFAKVKEVKLMEGKK